MATQKFELHLKGLLKVLAEHIYSTNLVGIRELIQNSHDAIQRRAIEEQPPSYQPRIDIETDRVSGTLSLHDNGAGLTEDEIHKYLAVIGASGTGELRQDLI
jgi:molecular chaperone HtpG